MSPCSFVSLLVVVGLVGHSEAFLQAAPPPFHGGPSQPQQQQQQRVVPQPLGVASRYFFSDYYKPPQPVVKTKKKQEQSKQVENHKGEQQFIKRSSELAALAWNKATQLAQGAVWLATDETSPAAPFKEAATEFVSHHLHEAQEQLVAHGHHTRQAILETTATVGRDLMARGQSAWENHQTKMPSDLPTANEQAQDLLAKIQSTETTITNKNAVVLDDDILEIQRVAQEIEAEVKAQIATPKLESKPANPEVVHRELLRARLAMQSRERKEAVLEPTTKPVSILPKNEVLLSTDEVVQPTIQNKDTDAFHRELLRTRLEMQLKERRGKTVKPSKTIQAAAKKRNLEVLQRKFLRDQFEMETKERKHNTPPPPKKPLKSATAQSRNAKHQEAFQRALLRTRLEIEMKERTRKAKAADVEQGVGGEDILTNALKQHQANGKMAGASEKDSNQKENDSLLFNASLGLTAPCDLLRDQELKKREKETNDLADEKVQQEKARIAEEQAKLRDLMVQVQRTSMEKKQRAMKAREEGSFPVIVAAVAQSDATRKPATFERPFGERGSAYASSDLDVSAKEATFEQLNKQIRMKYEKEQIKRKSGKKQQATFVVNKLERKRPSGVQKAATRVLKRSLKPLSSMAAALLQFYFTRVVGTTFKKSLLFLPAPPKKDHHYVPPSIAAALQSHST